MKCKLSPIYVFLFCKIINLELSNLIIATSTLEGKWMKKELLMSISTKAD